MIAIPASTRIYLCVPPTDMRKSFDGLVGLAQHFLRCDPQSGHLFVFVNKRRDRVKILQWDDDGYSLFYKRLEEGTYQCLPPLTDEEGKPLPKLQLTPHQLTLLLTGVDLRVRRRKRYEAPNTDRE